MTLDSPDQRHNALAALDLAVDALDRKGPWHATAHDRHAFAQLRAAIVSAEIAEPVSAETPDR